MSDVLDKVTENINESSILAELQREYDVFDLLSYNEYNALEKIERNPYLAEQFKLLRIREESKKKELEREFERRRGELYHQYRFENEIKLNKTEVEKYYLPQNEELNEMQKQIEEQQIRVEFFEALQEAFKTQGWQLKQYIQSLREGL